MITITYEKFMMALGLFTALCVAGGWLIKIIKGIKQPSTNIMKMLDSDNKKIKKLEDQQEYSNNAIKLLLRSEMAILGHLSTNNNTGEMAKAKKDLQEFLLNN